jgi:hypothetical protein
MLGWIYDQPQFVGQWGSLRSTYFISRNREIGAGGIVHLRSSCYYFQHLCRYDICAKWVLIIFRDLRQSSHNKLCGENINEQAEIGILIPCASPFNLLVYQVDDNHSLS